jgi:hypothetical protein
LVNRVAVGIVFSKQRHAFPFCNRLSTQQPSTQLVGLRFYGLNRSPAIQSAPLRSTDRRAPSGGIRLEIRTGEASAEHSRRLDGTPGDLGRQVNQLDSGFILLYGASVGQEANAREDLIADDPVRISSTGSSPWHERHCKVKN